MVGAKCLVRAFHSSLGSARWEIPDLFRRLRPIARYSVELMKILHTVQLYHPHKGGSEEVVRQISERLVARGHDVTVATGWDPRRQSKQLNGVKIRSFKIMGNEV